jgi:hypothetical protein
MRRGVGAIVAAAWLATTPAVFAAEGAPISPSERALFMTPHLAALKPPAALHYAVHKAGSLEPGFDDEVVLTLAPREDRACCTANLAFARSPDRQPQLQVDAAEGNPAIQYFLEHDIADMKRLTGGSANYFRQRIRLALAENAAMKPVTFTFRGRSVAGQEIDIAPYADDPLKARYEKFASKRYLFLLSSAVPGGVYGIRTRVVAEADGQPPLLVEEMMIEGAGPAAPGTPPKDPIR